MNPSKTDRERFFWLTKNKFISRAEKLLLKNVNLGKTCRVLEVGCGEGANIYNLTNCAKLTLGLDIDFRKLNFAASILKDSRFVCADALNMPFKDSYFDLVFCRDVLHHVPDRKAVVGEMIRVCKPYKEIVIIEANGLNLFWRIFGSIFNIEKAVKKNTIPEFKRLLIREFPNDFSKIEIGLLNYPIFLRLLMHYKFGISSLGNSKIFLVLFNVLNYFNLFSIKQYRPYIILTAIKSDKIIHG